MLSTAMFEGAQASTYRGRRERREGGEREGEREEGGGREGEREEGRKTKGEIGEEMKEDKRENRGELDEA